MQSPLPDLPAILTALRQGHPTAMGHLYAIYGPAISRYCYARLGTVEPTQECTQDVFVCIWKGIQDLEYRDAAAFKAWMYTIANNVVVSYVRKWQRASYITLNSDLDLCDGRSSNIARTICDRMALTEALNQLSVEQHQVVTLKFFGGLSHREIASALGRSEGAIKALQHRALKRLQQLLSAEGADQDVMHCYPTLPMTSLTVSDHPGKSPGVLESEPVESQTSSRSDRTADVDRNASATGRNIGCTCLS